MIETIDIIIPVYEPGESFERELEMLSAQEIPFGKLIVINTLPDSIGAKGAGFDSPEGETYPGAEAERVEDMIFRHIEPEKVIVKHIRKEDFDHAGTRRMAVELSEADAFLCMTDDAVPFDSFLTKQLLKSLNKRMTALAYARQIPAEDADEAERYSREFNYPDRSYMKTSKDIPSLGIKAYFASNVSAAYRRAVYDALGGFVSFSVFNEDMLYAARVLEAGYSIHYNADAKVIHSHNYGAVKQLRRNFDNGMSQAMHPEVFENISSETEGIRYVKETVKHLRRSGHTIDIPGFIWKSGFKYIGFRLGKMYGSLPKGLAERLSSNPALARRALERKEKEGE